MASVTTGREEGQKEASNADVNREEKSGFLDSLCSFCCFSVKSLSEEGTLAIPNN